MHHICAWCPRRPEEAVDAQELELQMAVSHAVGAGMGIKPGASGRATSALNCCAIFPALVYFFKAGPLLKAKLTCLPRWLVSEPAPTVLELQAYETMASFYMGPVYLNLGPPACTVSTLTH